MKLGASYNIFDGQELLKDSILSILFNVDYISVVYQTVSNHGNPCSRDLVKTLTWLKDEKLVNDLILYEPNLSKPPHFNEVAKRNIGLEYSKKAGCTHHISMDTDEFYDNLEFLEAKDEIEKGYDSSACRLLTYYKNNYTILDPIEDYYVSFIFRIREGLYYDIQPFPVLVDPTRRQKPGSFIAFDEDELIMHHFSYVRHDIKQKLMNSTARQNLPEGAIEKIAFNYSIWERGMDAFLSPDRIHSTKEIEPVFLKDWKF